MAVMGRAEGEGGEEHDGGKTTKSWQDAAYIRDTYWFRDVDKASCRAQVPSV